MEFLISILILLLLAKILGELAHRFGLSPLMGEVLAGIVLGPALLGLVDAGDAIYGVAMLGLVVMMLVTGMNSRFDIFTKIRFKALVIAVIGVVVSLLFGFFVSYSFGYGLLPSLFVAAALSNTATEVAARVTAGHPLNQLVVSAALVDDILAVYILGILSTSTLRGTLDLGVLIWATVGIVVFFLAVGYLSRLLIIKHDLMKRLWKYEARGAPLAFAVSLALALAVIAQNIGLHAIIGAYMAGLFIGRLRERPIITLQSRIRYNQVFDDISSSLQTILTPVFFAYVGLTLSPNWGQLNLLMLVALAVVAFGGKIIGCGGGAVAIGFNRRDSLSVGAGMCPRGSLELAVLHFGFISLRSYGFTPELFASMVVVVLITVILSPVLFKLSTAR